MSNWIVLARAGTRLKQGRGQPSDSGSSLMEVVVSVVLLALFTTATTMVLAQATGTSTDNRARVGASALAQRELEYASQAITQGEGSSALRKAGINGTVVNPNVPAELDTGPDQEYRFLLDGVRYKVVREATTWETTAGSACEADTVSGKTKFVYGTLVTVTVTWTGMGETTRPHVASQVFPPKRDETLGTDDSVAVVSVGVEDIAGVPQGGISVQFTGPGTTLTRTTSAKGCATFEVTPDPAGTDYVATLFGDGKSVWVNPSGEENPSYTYPKVKPQDSAIYVFEDGYERAAQLTVKVVNAQALAITTVQIEPVSDTAGMTRQAVLDIGGSAIFSLVYPGLYYLTALGAEAVLPPQPVELEPGTSPTAELVIP